MCSPPGGELLMHVQARAWSSLERIVSRYDVHAEANIAVVSHGDVIRGLLLLLLGMPLDHIHRLEVAPASVSEILLSAGEPRIRTINQVYEQAVH